MFGKNKFSAVAALAAIAAAAITDEQLNAANEQLEEIGITGAALIRENDFNALQAKALKADELEAKVKDMEAAAKVAGEEKAKLEGELKAAQDLVASYGSQPGATPTTPAATGQELSEEKPAAPAFQLDEEAQKYVAFAKEVNPQL